jgi:hypothetical protein
MVRRRWPQSNSGVRVMIEVSELVHAILTRVRAATPPARSAGEVASQRGDKTITI